MKSTNSVIQSTVYIKCTKELSELNGSSCSQFNIFVKRFNSSLERSYVFTSSLYKDSHELKTDI